LGIGHDGLGNGRWWWGGVWVEVLGQGCTYAIRLEVMG